MLVVDANVIPTFQLAFFRHGEAPSEEHVNAFVKICDTFIRKNPLEIIGTSVLILSLYK